MLLSHKDTVYDKIFTNEINIENEHELKMAIQVLSASLDGILVLDKKGFIIYGNEAIFKMYGASNKDELVGKHVLDFVAEQDKPKIAEKSAECAKGNRWGEIFNAKAKDGTLCPVEISVTPLINHQGEIIGAIDIIRDVTARLKIQKELEEANQKLRVLGGLVRHDIANSLSVLNGHCYLAKKSGKIEPLIDAIERAVSQIQTILTLSRDYEHLGTEQLCWVDVENVFNEAITTFPELKDKTITSKCSGLYVWADSLLRELFCNLISNTTKYGVKTTQVALSYKNEPNQLTLIYEDDGVGIPSADKQHIFSKGYGKGTGLGLYLMQKIINVYGWQIHEAGIDGEGARFIINVPNNKYKLTN